MSWQVRATDWTAWLPALPLLAVPLLALATPTVATMRTNEGVNELLSTAYVGALGLVFLTGVLLLVASPVLWLAGVLKGGRTLAWLGLGCADVLASAALLLWCLVLSLKGMRLF